MGNRPRSSGDGNDDRSAAPLEVFATGSTLLAEPGDIDADERLRRAAHNLHRGRDAVKHAYEVTRDLHAAPGDRPGAYATNRLRTRGRPSDIMHPVLVPPSVVTMMANSGELFAKPLPRLRLHDGPSGRKELTWSGELRRGVFRRRVPVTFQIRPSPSMVVTVLELIPQHVQRWTTRSFLRAGIRAVDELALRLEHASATA